MKRIWIPGVILAALAGGTVACSSPASRASAAPPASPSTAVAVVTTQAPQVTDPNGVTCPVLDGLGYCPGDDPTQAPQVTDPNGVTCDTLDSLGYCPGDDPTPMQQWCNGNGYSDYQNVQSDLTQMGTDAGNNDLLSVEQDGAQLAQDAKNAFEDLPPGSKHQKFYYGMYMSYMLIAGLKAVNGDVAGTDSALSSTDQFKSTVLGLVNQCTG